MSSVFKDLPMGQEVLKINTFLLMYLPLFLVFVVVATILVVVFSLSSVLPVTTGRKLLSATTQSVSAQLRSSFIFKPVNISLKSINEKKKLSLIFLNYFRYSLGFKYVFCPFFVQTQKFTVWLDIYIYNLQ